MAMKINIGITRKIGQPNFGSRGASCNVEFELDGSFDNGGANRFHEATRTAYIACREAVAAELALNDSSRPSSDVQSGSGGPPTSNGRYAQNDTAPPADANQKDVRKATSSQVRAVYAIANRHQVDLPAILSAEYRVDRPDDLSIGAASRLIDQLKSAAAGNGSRR